MKRNLNLVAISALILAGCHTSKQVVTPSAVIVNDTDSIQMVYIETVTIDTVKVSVPFPIESAKQIVGDSISHLETSLAFSDAWINSDGSLGHSIINKSGVLDTDVLVPTITRTNEKESIREKEIPIPEPYPVEVERKLTLMEQIKLAAFWYLLGAVIVSMGYIFRRPLLLALRKIIRL